MSDPALYDGLKLKYPKLFTPEFYVECDDGWYNIIDSLCNLIQSHIEGHNAYARSVLKRVPTGDELISVPTLLPQTHFTQIKEKFGSLRVYIDTGDVTIYAYLEFAEHLSSKVCEVCGNVGHTINTAGWLTTRCEAHAEKSK